ncbi:hypothetical protein [Marinicella sp. W31]|uniref:hypothetical protein n=1 Tax=Marinicella sp. W31 TaxID=3023713 RepID=UPI00375773F4
MKKMMIIGLFSMLLLACSNDDKQATQAEQSQQPNTVAVTSSAEHEIMKYIPADTPLLVLSGLSDMPERYVDITNDYMNNMGKYFQTIAEDYFEAMRTLKEKYAEASEDEVDQATAESNAMQENLQAFYETWLKEEPLKNLGFQIGGTQLAMYAVDLLPVLRMKLAPGHKISEMIEDAKTRFNAQARLETIGDYQVNHFDIDKTASFVVALNNNEELVAFVVPNVLEEQLKPQLLGTQLPAKSMLQDKSVLNGVQSKHGYILDEGFYIDLAQVANYFIYPEKHDLKMLDFMQIEDDMLSQNCKTEISAMIAKSPRLVAGVKEFNNEKIVSSFVWELAPELTADLASMTGRIPQTSPDAAFAFGFSFDLLKGRDVINKYVKAVMDDPFKCELMAEANEKLSGIQAQLNQPLPPFIGNFKGANFALDDFQFDEDRIDELMSNPQELLEGLKMHMLFAVDQTQSLVGMAQMMVPQLQGLEVKTDGTAINLAEYIPVSGSDIPFDASTMFMAMSGNTIGLSMGYEEGNSLSEMVKGENDDALLSFSANGQAYKNLIEKVFLLAEKADLPDEMKQELAMQKALTKDGIWWKSQKGDFNFENQGFTVNVDISY